MGTCRPPWVCVAHIGPRGRLWATKTLTPSAPKRPPSGIPTFTEQVKNRVGPLVKRYFRAEVRGLDAIPSAGGALLISNHSGGMFTPDVLVFVPAFYHKFGFDRPVYTLAHNALFAGPIGDWLRRVGVIEANRENAAKALRSGALVLVFPGGDYDSYRPTFENKIDFAGRTGYVRPQSNPKCRSCRWCPSARRRSQLFLTRGNWLAKRLGLRAASSRDPADHVRIPVWAQRVLPSQRALPTKIVTQVLDPIDVLERVRRGSRYRRRGRSRPRDHADRVRRSWRASAASRSSANRRASSAPSRCRRC